MKIRLKYAKTEEGRYLSHLDLAKTMERSLRRADIPLDFSEGFNPHPKLSFASALAVGITGQNEYLDIELRKDMKVNELAKAINKAMPKALRLQEIKEVPMQGKSLSSMINLAEYSFLVTGINVDQIQAGIRELISAKEVWRKPKLKPGKKPVPSKEVRGLISWINAQSQTDNNVKLAMGLVLSNTGQLRPQEIWQMIAEFGKFESVEIQEVCRTGLYIQQGDKTYLPMGGDQQNAQRDFNAGRWC